MLIYITQGLKIGLIYNTIEYIILIIILKAINFMLNTEIPLSTNEEKNDVFIIRNILVFIK